MKTKTYTTPLLAGLAVAALMTGALAAQGIDLQVETPLELQIQQALETGDTLDILAEGDWEPQRLRISLEDYLEQLGTQEPQGHGALAPNHLDYEGIRPGQGILVSIPGEGTFICSISFIFEDKRGALYAGTAGHCLLPGNAVATHNEGSNNYDPSGVMVYVCKSGCLLGGFLSGFGWNTDWLGPVEYARQSDSARPGCTSGGVGNDFGVIRIREALYPDVNPAMAVWHGPHGQAGWGPTGQTLVHYGNGVTAGTTAPSSARVAVALNDGIVCSWQAIGHVYGGDSGSAISFGGTQQGLVLHGQHALGTVTHTIGIGVAFGTPAFGTTVPWGIHMADRDAGLDLVLVEP